MNIKYIFCGAIALFGLSCSNKNDNYQQESIQSFSTIVVSKQSTKLEQSYPVVIKGREDIEIRPRVDGFIDAIYVDEGSVVRKGQSLFKINSPASEQALKSAKATLRSNKARLNTALTNVNRLRPLAEQGIISKVQLQTAEDVYETAQAELAQAQAEVENAEATLSWSNVISPVDGILGIISFRQGSLVNSSDILTTVANTNNVYAYFSLNEKELMHLLDRTKGESQKEKIKNLHEVVLTLANGTLYSEKGKIETISGIIDGSTGSVNFRAEFPNKEGKLRSGASGRVSIPEVINDAIIIPQKSTFSQQNKLQVYKVSGDSIVQTIISATEMPDGQNYVVVKGLSAGDRIVSEGVATLRHGQKIAVKE
jgi:membrane fusion protein (multidrug efflux system)